MFTNNNAKFNKINDFLVKYAKRMKEIKLNKNLLTKLVIF
jgi:hypothetical protein